MIHGRLQMLTFSTNDKLLKEVSGSSSICGNKWTDNISSCNLSSDLKSEILKKRLCLFVCIAFVETQHRLDNLHDIRMTFGLQGWLNLLPIPTLTSLFAASYTVTSASLRHNISPVWVRHSLLNSIVNATILHLSLFLPIWGLICIRTRHFYLKSSIYDAACLLFPLLGLQLAY